MVNVPQEVLHLGAISPLLHLFRDGRTAQQVVDMLKIVDILDLTCTGAEDTRDGKEQREGNRVWRVAGDP